MNDKNGSGKKPVTQSDWIWYMLGLLGLLFFLGTLGLCFEAGQEIPYSEFRSLLAKNAISDVVVGPSTITGTIKPQAKNGELKSFTTTLVEPSIADDLQKHNVKFSGEKPASWLERFTLWILPMILFAGFWFLLLRRSGMNVGGLMGVRAQQCQSLCRARRQSQVR